MSGNGDRGFDVYAAAGGLIAKRRNELGMSQAALAELVGLTRTSISNIEQGRQRMLVHTLMDIAAALGVIPSKLLPRDREAASLKISHNVSDAERATIEAILRRVHPTP